MNERSENETATFTVPVPREIYQDGDIAWFEAEVSGRDKRIQLVAHTFDGLEVGRAEARLTGELDIQTTITGAQSEVRITLSPVADAEGDVRVRGSVNGQDFTIGSTAGGQSDVETTYPRIELALAESQLIKDWSVVGQSLTVMAQAMRVRPNLVNASSARASCAGCVVHGAGEAVLAAACVDGALAACGAFLVTWPSFVKHCTGACA